MPAPVNVFQCSAEELMGFEQVGEKTASEVLALVETALDQRRNLTVDELVGINAKVKWGDLVSGRSLDLANPEVQSGLSLDKFKRETELKFREMSTKLDIIMRSSEKKDALVDTVLERLDSVGKFMESCERRFNSLACEVEEVRTRPPMFVPPSFPHIPAPIPVSSPPGFPTPFTLSSLTSTRPPMCPTMPPTHMNTAPVTSPPGPLPSVQLKIEEVTKQGVYTRSKSSEPRGAGAEQVTLTDTVDKDERHDTGSRGRGSGYRVRPDIDQHDRRDKGDRSQGNGHRDRSRSPQPPRMQTFSGGPDNSLKFDVFIQKFERIAERRLWDNDKKLDRLFDCLTDQALEYANRSRFATDYDMLLADMKVRFDFADEPMAARQKLSVMEQIDESEEQFVHRIQALANDGYKGCMDQNMLDRIMTEAFLRGLKDKEAALDALGYRPATIQGALRHVKGFLANKKVLGLTKAKTVTFQEKAVGLAPGDSGQDIGESLLRGIESLLKTHLGSRSRSPSPYKDRPYDRHHEYGNSYDGRRERDRNRDPNRRYRKSGHYDGYRRQYTPSPRRDYGYDMERSPRYDRRQYSSGSYRRYSPERYRGYSPERTRYDAASPSRDRDHGHRDREGRRVSPSPYRHDSPRDSRYRSPSPFRKSHRDFYKDRDRGREQNRQPTYDARPVSPAPQDKTDLNF